MCENLGKFEHEVLELSPDEYARWVAYYKIKAEDKDKPGPNKRPRRARAAPKRGGSGVRVNRKKKK